MIVETQSLLRMEVNNNMTHSLTRRGCGNSEEKWQSQARQAPDQVGAYLQPKK